jgi:UDP-GlcNAc3NAcA epimerase
VADGYPVAHVEAGMRSFDRSMPEEVNRIATDELSEVLLCSSQVAVDNLEREGISGRIELVGDVMVDIALLLQPRAKADLEPLREAGVSVGEYLLVTAHRAGNVDVPERLERLVELAEHLPLPAIFPVHPRTRARLRAAGLEERLEAAVHVTQPLGYLDFLKLARHAGAILTDSGGVQKEAYLLGVPCVTLRDRTEWIETVDAGWNVLVDLDRDAALAALERTPPRERPELYGGGHAAERVCDVVSAYTPRL